MSQFGTDAWRPILADRQSGVLDADCTRDELINLMRCRLETALSYEFTHSPRLTNLWGTPLYDMIFVSDHEVGVDKIMSSVYRPLSRKRSEHNALRSVKDLTSTSAADDHMQCGREDGAPAPPAVAAAPKAP